VRPCLLVVVARRGARPAAMIAAPGAVARVLPAVVVLSARRVAVWIVAAAGGVWLRFSVCG
jgi:hypothetical protein